MSAICWLKQEHFVFSFLGKKGIQKFLKTLVAMNVQIACLLEAKVSQSWLEDLLQKRSPKAVTVSMGSGILFTAQ